jgi:hypothetical protein
MYQTNITRIRSTKSNISLVVASILLLCGLSQTAIAQSRYTSGGKQTVMRLYGTSTLHDWTMTAHRFAGAGTFTVSEANVITAVPSLSLSLPVHNLKGESGGLNDNAYEALKADKFKTITFASTVVTITADGAQKYHITAAGNLSIAGVTNAVTLVAATTMNADGTITTVGTLRLKMSDYNVKPPTFMLGAMSAGDGMTLKYTLVFTH